MRRLGVLAIVLVALLSLSAVPATASPPIGFDPSSPPPPDPNPAGTSTEATIVEMIHTSGLFGGDVPAATALTPYPTAGLQNQRTVTTAQIVLDDPTDASDDTVLAYCIDLGTDTTIGIHYELGTWTSADVPNLPYVQWILENHYPQVPAAPAAGTDAEKVRAVQGAIWYFTDTFVVSPAYPAERAAVASIVAAAQAAVGPSPTPPDLPTLTVDPVAREASVPGEIVGPFAVGGTVTSATLDLGGTAVYADAAGTSPLADGATVLPGDELWVRFDPGVAGQGFALTSVAEVPAGNVFLYDGDNPPRATAQKLVLAADVEVPLRAVASIVAEAAGALQVDVVLSGSAAGLQSRVDLIATCVATGGWELTRPIFVPAATPAGTTIAAVIRDVPAGALCSVAQTADGANAGASIVSSTITPPSATIASDVTTTISVANEYAVPPAQTGSFAVDVVVGGAAAGEQSAIVVDAACVLGADTRRATFTVTAGATGTVAAGVLSAVPAGAVCTADPTSDGADADAVLESSTVTPASVAIVVAQVSRATVTNVYSAAAPAPSPSPSRSALPDSGSSGVLPWGWGALAVAIGIATVATSALRGGRGSRRHRGSAAR